MKIKIFEEIVIYGNPNEYDEASNYLKEHGYYQTRLQWLDNQWEEITAFRLYGEKESFRDDQN
jgi:uncharacterized protein YozE (UPF0346 family)